MKKTPVEISLASLPDEIIWAVEGARIYDSSCSPNAEVYYIDRGPGYYLKVSGGSTLRSEALMDEFFHGRGLGPAVLQYVSNEKDYLLTERLAGEDLTDKKYLSDGKRLATHLGETLRMLHSLSTDGCPVKNRTEEYLRTAENNFLIENYDSTHFPDSFGYKSAEDAYRVLCEGKGQLKADTLLHGDFCLPNIIMNGYDLSGFIDLGQGGVGDRHIDIFWGAWTLRFNLGTDQYTEYFFDAYGKERIDKDILRTVAAAEVFG